MFRISFCTVAMNRLAHIKATFIRNILENIDYPEVEFNLLDYNSTDGLEEWAKNELKQYIDTGIVNYYKTGTPAYFQRSHSRNMIFKLSSGDIICNVDADNFCGAGFADYINEIMITDNNIERSFLVSSRNLKEEEDRNSYGRIAVNKDDFLALKGFDERMEGYGFEDTDFINRLQKHGKTPLVIENERYLKGISHSQSLRISEERYYKTISNILIAQIRPYESRVLFLFNNHIFHYATLINYEVMASLRYQYDDLVGKCSDYKYPIEFKDHEVHSGVWQECDNTIRLQFNDKIKNASLIYQTRDNIYEDANSKEQFFIVTSEYLKENIIYLFPQIQNRNYMDANLTNDSVVNHHGYGRGTVRKNFGDRQIQVM